MLSVFRSLLDLPFLHLLVSVLFLRLCSHSFHSLFSQIFLLMFAHFSLPSSPLTASHFLFSVYEMHFFIHFLSLSLAHCVRRKTQHQIDPVMSLGSITQCHVLACEQWWTFFSSLYTFHMLIWGFIFLFNPFFSLSAFTHSGVHSSLVWNMKW